MDSAAWGWGPGGRTVMSRVATSHGLARLSDGSNSFDQGMGTIIRLSLWQ